MFVFTHQNLMNGIFDHAIARRNGNQYFLVLSRVYGLAPYREISHLNVSTPQSSTPLPLSNEGRPCIWLDCSTDRSDFIPLQNPSIVTALLNAQPKPIIKLCGLTRRISPPTGTDRYSKSEEIEVEKVELLLSEDELVHSCYYCGELEMDGSEHFERIGGKGYNSTYGCAECMSTPWISRAVFEVAKCWDNKQ
ncbi:unnamed protein product [Cyclocybe aegerita]|uniref:Uncharacterized protein n=1 Tax=Cyclocybe aegerita TaxID=1973307 RepID=A0A8S0VSH9_CYCAE|nr:unnamed protein product [Cyclocybe aegerita]